MESKGKILNVVRCVGYTVLAIGIAIFSYGFFVSDYSLATGVGIGTVMGAVFIYLMGVFFVVTEEMLEKTLKGKKIVPLQLVNAKKGTPFTRRSF